MRKPVLEQTLKRPEAFAYNNTGERSMRRKLIVPLLILCMLPTPVRASDFYMEDQETLTDSVMEDQEILTDSAMEASEEETEAEQEGSAPEIPAEEDAVSEETAVPETAGEASVVSEEELLSSGDPDTEAIPDPNLQEEETDPIQLFVDLVFGRETSFLELNDDDSVLVTDAGVLFPEYTVSEEGRKIPSGAVLWDDASDVWYQVSADGSREPVGPGTYNFYGDTIWYLNDKSSGYGGYVIDGDTWEYYLGYADIQKGYAVYAAEERLLPDEIYHGAKWTDPSVYSVKAGYHTCQGAKYYLKKDGTILQNGIMKINGRTYEFGPDGKETRSYMTNYWKQERLGYYVRVDENGNIIRTAGFYEFDGNSYYLCGSSGRRIQGWFTTKGSTFYFDPDTGAQVFGYQVIDGVPYYFNPDSALPGRMVKNSNVFIDGQRYYFGYEDGSLITGWITGGTDGGHKYYVNPDASLRTGWNRIASENRTYYFDPKWGYAVQGLQTIDGNLYLFVEGTDAVGRNWVTYKDSKYYCDPKTAVVTTGLRTISEKLYYFDETGKLVTNKEYFRIDGKYYNIDAKGKCTEAPLTEAQKLAKDRLDEIGWDLLSAYRWSVMNYYYNSDKVPEGMTELDYFSSYGFNNHRGDCYVMAATFCQMALMLGYDAHFVMGYVPTNSGGYEDHGWVEIDQEGTTYIYDPEFEYICRTLFGASPDVGWKFLYKTRGTPRYTNE